MHLSIDTRKLDNGWILEAKLPWLPCKEGAEGCKEIHEVYTNPTQVRKRVMGLLRRLLEGLREGIPEKVS